MIDLVTIPRFCELTGYTDDAVRAKMAGGVWLQDYVWVRAPDGRILISIRGYQLWVVGQGLDPSESIRYRLTFDGTAGATVNDFASRQRPRISNMQRDSRRP